jgi:hypothetical protein
VRVAVASLLVVVAAVLVRVAPPAARAADVRAARGAPLVGKVFAA